MQFRIGDRIRINFWVDRRESGFRCGTVKSCVVDCFGARCQKVQWDAGYESTIAISLFELVIEEA